MDFGTQLQELRKKQKITQEQMAKDLGVTRQAVSNWENNRNLPDLEILIRMSKQYHLTLDELILGEEENMNNMTEKLIEDTKESTKLKSAVRIVIAGVILMVIGILCFVIKGMTVEYIDAQGILHENFFFIPIGFLFLFTGAVVSITGGIRALLLKMGRKSKRSNTI